MRALSDGWPCRGVPAKPSESAAPCIGRSEVERERFDRVCAVAHLKMIGFAGVVHLRKGTSQASRSGGPLELDAPVS